MTSTITPDRLYDLRIAVDLEVWRTIGAALSVAGYRYTEADTPPAGEEFVQELLALHARDLARATDALPPTEQPAGWDSTPEDVEDPWVVSTAMFEVVRAAMTAARCDFTIPVMTTPESQRARRRLALAARQLAHVMDGQPACHQPVGWHEPADTAWWRQGCC
ncbi:hypothetical protein GCM10010124_00190 [Pilimelia terevasa]|uniref:Uncharacterized protein n=1 Tax=Pilimelia terevasa TaxID=53372 RepID=A0A8J3BIQ4_9ACTN|nr:hypothetical protein [Pilimelia terevasa]GGK11534.1 hypothetical protein GCM10010124_00190 [Pilimelia terevasa]